MIIYVKSELVVSGVVPSISRSKHVDLLETLKHFVFIADFHPFGETFCYSGFFPMEG